MEVLNEWSTTVTIAAIITCVSLLKGLLRYSGGKSLSDDALSDFLAPSSPFLKGKTESMMLCAYKHYRSALTFLTRLLASKFKSAKWQNWVFWHSLNSADVLLEKELFLILIANLQIEPASLGHLLWKLYWEGEGRGDFWHTCMSETHFSLNWAGSYVPALPYYCVWRAFLRHFQFQPIFELFFPI